MHQKLAIDHHASFNQDGWYNIGDMHHPILHAAGLGDQCRGVDPCVDAHPTLERRELATSQGEIISPRAWIGGPTIVAVEYDE